MIDIGSLWMFDLKLGVCVEQFWFNKEHCCWTSNESTFGMHDCREVGAIVALVELVPNVMLCTLHVYCLITVCVA